eukprot:14592930-Alexandrium_andersonii.AAC.1
MAGCRCLSLRGLVARPCVMVVLGLPRHATHVEPLVCRARARARAQGLVYVVPHRVSITAGTLTCQFGSRIF